MYLRNSMQIHQSRCTEIKVNQAISNGMDSSGTINLSYTANILTFKYLLNVFDG